VQLGTGGCGFTVVWLGQQDKSRGAFLGNQHRLAVAAEQQIVGFPVAGLPAGIDIKWAFSDGYAVFDVLNGAASLAAAIAPFELGAR